MSSSPSVLVIGAGPTGLTLAAELALAGLSCRVLDKRAERSPRSRAFGLLPRTLEMLDLRGQADALVDQGLPWNLAPLGDGKRWLDYRQLDSTFPYMLVIPQSRTEERLEAWALKAGTELVRGAQVVGLRWDESGVDVDVVSSKENWTERVDFVVGCDGVRSTVRELAGIAFHGRAYASSLVVADVTLSDPPDPPVHARTRRRGMVAAFPFGDGTFRLVILDQEHMGVPADQPVTEDELRRSCQAILGTDFGLQDVTWVSRYRSDQRISACYRRGRVLLAGDAAHTHIPSGGQGLQTGIQDAMNLGWKLAAVLSGWAPAYVLDSYERERLPIAQATLRKADLIFRFETSQSAGNRALRWLSKQLMTLPRIQIPVIEQLSGTTLHYPSVHRRSQHRLVGRRIPDTVLGSPGDGSTRLYEHFRDGTFVLLDSSPGGICASVVARDWSDRVRVVRAAVVGRTDLPEAVLIRPDGYAAWAGNAAGTHDLAAALRYWCGVPRRPGSRYHTVE